MPRFSNMEREKIRGKADAGRRASIHLIWAKRKCPLMKVFRLPGLQKAHFTHFTRIKKHLYMDISETCSRRCGAKWMNF